MRNDAPALLPIFRSRTQAEILTWLTQNPDSEATISDLARLSGAPMATAHRDIGRLEEAGLVTIRSHGRHRLVQVRQGHPALAPITQLLALTFGPPAVIAEEFALDGAEQVVIFGSWAARNVEISGPQPNDVDVLIVGHAPLRELFAAAGRAEARIGLPVNPQTCTPERWHNPGDDALIRQIQGSPHLTVHTTENGADDSALDHR